MNELDIIINHCDDKQLELHIHLEEDSMDMIKVILKTHIENSFDNAAHLLKRNLYPSSKLNMKVQLKSSNFIKSEKAIASFNNHNLLFINELISKSNIHPLFSREKIKIDEEDIIPGFSNYMEREKCFNKIRSGFTKWKADQDYFLNNKQKKEATNASLKKPKT